MAAIVQPTHQLGPAPSHRVSLGAAAEPTFVEDKRRAQDGSVVVRRYTKGRLLGKVCAC